MDSVNIGVDATGMGWQKGGGAFYVINIIKALSQTDRDNQYYVFCSDKSYSSLGGLPGNFLVLKAAPTNVALRLLWEQTVLPFYLCRKYRISVMFGPNYIVPFFKPGFRTVVTIFDLSFYPLAALYPVRRRLFQWIIRWSILRADNIIAISECTKRDILKYVGDYSEKITVIYLAAEERFREAVPKEETDVIRKRYKIGGNPYLLYVGFLEPRKNVERLLRAFASVKDKIPHLLVIAGGKGWWYDDTYALAESLNLKNRIIFTGYVPDEDLPALYTGADLLAFLSLYEGFGIAALEAICCGTPVLASNNSALPEVVGEAGMLADPYDINDISEKMLLLLNDAERMKICRSRCATVSNNFNWYETAQRTLKILVAHRHPKE